MPGYRNIANALRRAAKRLRSERRGIARPAARLYRFGHCIQGALFWPRVVAARLGLLPMALRASTLARKGVLRPAPTLRVAGPGGGLEHFDEGFAAAHALLFANLRMPDLVSERRYALPGPAFRGVGLWDSAFAARIWRWWDASVAADALQSVLALRDGPRLQQSVTAFQQSEYTQPPLLAWALDALCDAGEPADLAQTYAVLRDYHSWLDRNRRSPTGLFAWRHARESGMDNSPRFANRDESQVEGAATRDAPDLCSYVVLQAEALASIAARLGRPADTLRYREEADALRAAMNARLWHEADGVYYDRDQVTGEWIRCRTIASLLPLWAKVPDAARARRMLAQIMDPARFGTLMPLPSVARDDPSFEPDMWRGPVWVGLAYGVLLGMRRYGFDREAAELAWRICDGVYRVFASERAIVEFYDPDRWTARRLTRKGASGWRRLLVGGGPQRDCVGASGLANTIAIELLFGFSVTRGRRRARPTFPPAAVGAILQLRLPVEDLLVEIAVESEDRFRGLAQDGRGLRRFTASFGESVDLDALLAAPEPRAAQEVG